jgi:short-subunit dehydrogenase
MSKFKNVLITGASSGLGRALAIELSKKSQNLFLCARNFENLQETKNLCQNSNANIYLKILDVKDEIASQNYITEIEENFALDLIIANAGISGGTAQGTESFAQIKEIFDTNLYGVLNIVQPVIEKMTSRKSGQIVIISSLAGFVSLPSSPAYSASKSAVRIYGEALRGNLAEFGVKVNIVCPGYIKTKMTAVNNFYMPFLMNSTKASQIIINGIEKNHGRIIFPIIFYFLIRVLLSLPFSLIEKIMKKLPKKSALKK